MYGYECGCNCGGGLGLNWSVIGWCVVIFIILALLFGFCGFSFKRCQSSCQSSCQSTCC